MVRMSRIPVLLVGLCLLISSCGPQSGNGQPFLSIDQLIKSEFETGAKIRQWSLRGRGVKSVSVRMEVFADGDRKEMKRIVFSDARESREFRGQVVVLLEEGELWGAAGKHAVSLQATIDEGFSSRGTSGGPLVFETARSHRAESVTEEGPVVDLSGSTHLWSLEYAEPDLALVEVKRTAEEWTEYSKEGRTVIIVTLDCGKR
jgi:hypothetical protein